MDEINQDTEIISVPSDYEGDPVLYNDSSVHQLIVEKGEINREEGRLVEKRQRCESSENISEEEDFTLVQRKSKRILRSTSTQDETFDVSLSSKQVLPKQIGMAKLMRAENINNILRIKYKGPYKVIISFKNKIDAEKLMNNKKITELEYRCQPTTEVQISYGVIKDIDLDINEEEIIKEFKCDVEIIAVRRLKRLNENSDWVPSLTIRVAFKCSTLPPYIFGYGCRFKVDPYTFPVSQCSGCWKFGHLNRACPTKKIVCPKCGQNHQNCDSVQFICVNCKGPHMALDKTCPFFIKEKEIRSIMCQNNLTYKSALSTYCLQKALIRESGEKRETLNSNAQFFPVLNKSLDQTNHYRKNKSYRDVLIAEVEIHPRSKSLTDLAQDSEEGDTNFISQNVEDQHIPKRKSFSKKVYSLNKPSQDNPDKITMENSNKSSDDINNKSIKCKKFVEKIKEIILSKKEIKDKFFDVLWLIVGELGDLLSIFVKNSVMLNKFLSFFNG